MSRYDDDRSVEQTTRDTEKGQEEGKDTARRYDSDWMRHLQSLRSHESLSQAGKLGFRATAERHGYDSAMEFSARFWRQHPERASLPERQMMGMLESLGQERGRDYEHIYMTAPGVWSDFAWPNEMKAVEVWGGVHGQDFRQRVDPAHAVERARRDEQRIESMQYHGWELKIVMARELQPSQQDRTREQIQRYLSPVPRDEQLFLPGVFSPYESEEARRYQASMEVVQLLEQVGQKTGDDYARFFRVTRDTEPVSFAWIDNKRAAHLYRDANELMADKERRQILKDHGWSMLVLTEDRDLQPNKKLLVRAALASWSRGENRDRPGE